MSFLRVHAGLILLTACAPAQPSAVPYTAVEGQQFMRTNCGTCHGGKSRAGGFDITRLAQTASFREESEKWSKAALRVHNGEMPPGGAFPLEKREAFAGWVRENLRQAACSDGMVPGPSPIRRLSRTQYTATVRDLLNLHVDVGATLPADSAGGEGFDNAAETLFLSPIYAEKYLEAAKLALELCIEGRKVARQVPDRRPGSGCYPRGGSEHHSGRVSAASVSTSGGKGGSRFLHGPVLVRGEARRFIRGRDSLQPPRGAVVPAVSFPRWNLEIQRARRACWMIIRWHRGSLTLCGAARRTVYCSRLPRQAS